MTGIGDRVLQALEQVRCLRMNERHLVPDCSYTNLSQSGAVAHHRQVIAMRSGVDQLLLIGKLPIQRAAAGQAVSHFA